MLDRLIPLVPTRAREMLRSLIARRPLRESRPTPTIPPDLDTRPAAMRPLHPPQATNDNPLEVIHEAVERELRARGHLR